MRANFRTKMLLLVLLAFAGLLVAGLSCRRDADSVANGRIKLPADPPEAKGPPFYKDMTAATGIDFSFRNGQEAGHYAILESLGGGVGLIDYDGDGLLDIFLPAGGYYDGLDKKTIRGHPCKLYKNM